MSTLLELYRLTLFTGTREDPTPLRRSPRIYDKKKQQPKAQADAPVKRRRAPVATLPEECEEG